MVAVALGLSWTSVHGQPSKVAVLSPSVEASAAVLALKETLRRDEPARLITHRVCRAELPDPACPPLAEFSGPDLPGSTLSALSAVLASRAVARDSAIVQMQRPLASHHTIVVWTYVTRRATDRIPMDSSAYDMDEYEVRMQERRGVLTLLSAKRASQSEIRMARPPVNRTRLSRDARRRSPYFGARVNTR